MLTQMAVESFEDNLFYAAWDNIAKPHVEKVLDGLIPVTDKNDWVNNALRESMEFVIMMAANMAYQKVLQEQDKFFELLNRIYQKIKNKIMDAIRNFSSSRKNRIKSKRGFAASTLLQAASSDNSKSSSVEVQKLHAMEVNNHIQSRIASASAVTTLQPAATANQYAVQKKELYADLAFSRNKLLIDSLDFKAKLGRFSNSDVKQIKRFSAPDDMSFRGLDVNDLKPLQGIHMVKDTQGRYIGRAELDFAMLSYYGYMPPNH